VGIFASYEKKDYTPATEGLWQAVCADVIDLGLVKDSFGEKHKVKIVWLTEEIDQKNNRNMQVSKRYNLSLHEKATLRKDLESWRGRKFNQEELKKFDLEKLIGANCQLSISHNVKDEGEVYANVQAVVPLGKQTGKMRVPDDYVRFIDRDKSNGNGRTSDAAEPEEEYTPF
jgi:hypothetical protein